MKYLFDRSSIKWSIELEKHWEDKYYVHVNMEINNVEKYHDITFTRGQEVELCRLATQRVTSNLHTFRLW